MKRLFLIPALLLIVLTLLAPGCGTPAPAPEPPTAQLPASAPSTGIEVQLSLSEPPALGKLVQLTCAFSIISAPILEPSVTARVILPQGFELVEGVLEWQGDIVPNKDITYKIKATIRATRAGDCEIEARVGYPVNGIGYIGDGDVLYISVFKDSAIVSDRRIRTKGIVYGLPPGYPLRLEVKPSPPPLLGEPFKLRVNINALSDVAQAKAYVEFYRLERKAPVKVALADILIEGDLTWQGSLERDALVQPSGTVVLPEEGDWEITAYCSIGESAAIQMHSIFLHVGKNESRFFSPIPEPE